MGLHFLGKINGFTFYEANCSMEGDGRKFIRDHRIFKLCLKA